MITYLTWLMFKDSEEFAKDNLYSDLNKLSRFILTICLDIGLLLTIASKIKYG